MRQIFPSNLSDEELRSMSPRELERAATHLLRASGLLDRMEASQREFEKRLILTPQNGMRRPRISRR